MNCEGDSTSTSSDEELAGTSDSLSNEMYAADYDDKAAHRRLRVNRRLNVDCDACNKTCEWYDVGCHAEKLACWSTGVTFEAFTSGVEGICNNDPDRTQAKELRDKATQILVDKKLFTAGELNSAKIRFCSALNLPEPDTGGMAPSRNKVLINTSYIQSTPKELAKLLAHEYTHIRQYERWGTDKFNCLYSKQILAGNGYGMKNWIEKEAYDFAQKASKIIDDDTPVSQTGIQTYSKGEFEIGWDLFKPHNSGTKTVGMACHPGCKKHSATVTPADPNRLACGGQKDTKKQYWASFDPTDCRLKIPYCRHNVDSSPCRWEIKELCE